MPRITKKRATASKHSPSSSPPPPSPLLSLPPELRNSIYHLVAEEIDEVTIIGRKVNDSLLSRLYNESITGSALWKAAAKHPLSQTCKQVRLEFDPIHQHRVFTTKVSRYYLELENFDLTLIPRFTAAISRMPSLLAHLRNGNGLRPTQTIRFQLNKYAWDSVDALHERLRREGYLANPFKQLETLNVFTEKEVVFNFRNTPGLSAAPKKAGMTQQGPGGHAAVDRKLEWLAGDLRARWTHLSRSEAQDFGLDVAIGLQSAYFRAQHSLRFEKRMQRQK